MFSLHVWGPGANNLLYRSWEMLYSTLTSVLFFRFFSLIGYYKIQSTVPYILQVVSDDLFYTRPCAYVSPKLLVYPSLPFPFGNRKLPKVP